MTTAEKKRVFEILDLRPDQRPLIQGGEDLLYPFLVLEAKSGKAADDWNRIRRQTSFAIKAFLDAQKSLFTTADEDSSRKIWPLVWYISNKGDIWTVSAAYIKNAHKRPGTVGRLEYVRT